MRASRQRRIPEEFSGNSLHATAPTKLAPTQLPPTKLSPTKLSPVQILTNETLVTLNELVKSSTSTKTNPGNRSIARH